MENRGVKCAFNGQKNDNIVELLMNINYLLNLLIMESGVNDTSKLSLFHFKFNGLRI